MAAASRLKSGIFPDPYHPIQGILRASSLSPSKAIAYHWIEMLISQIVYVSPDGKKENGPQIRCKK